MRWIKAFIAGLRLTGIVLLEVLLIAYPVTTMLFGLGYLGDMFWGVHKAVPELDKLFIKCLVFGIGCGMCLSIFHTITVFRNLRTNRNVK